MNKTAAHPSMTCDVAQSAAFDDDSPPSEFPLTRFGQVLLVALAALLVAGFALAAYLEPDPRGLGTHQQLGFPPCTFLFLFGLRCPSCGSTTCFAHYVRGDWGAAIEASISAFALAGICTALIPWCLVSAARGRLWKVACPVTLGLWIVGSVVTLSLIQWCWYLIFQA
jgi:hypothetical protein